jgi:7-cyano-7-deazaguanine synthase
MSKTSDKSDPEKVTFLLSGGIDSAFLGWKLLKSGAEVSGIYVNYGQRAFLRGRAAVNAFAQKARISVEILEVPRLVESFIRSDDHGTVWACSKRIIFITAAAFWAFSSDCVALEVGLTKNDIDRLKADGEDTKRVIEGLENAVIATRGGQKKFEIRLPIQALSKADVVSKALEMNCPLELTWSCEFGGDLPCGKCIGCKERKAAFAAIKRKDPALDVQIPMYHVH